MHLKDFLKDRFGKDFFTHLEQNDILEERIKAEKKIEGISDDIKGIQENIQKLMLDAKGQTKTYKMLNIQKIKALRLEAKTKQQEANSYLRELQLLLLLEAMREHHKSKETNEFIEKILDSDVESLDEVLFSEDVKKSIEEGKLDDVKDRLKRVFAKEEIPADTESQELLQAIDDLEQVDEETAIKLAGEKAKKVAEAPRKKEVLEEE